MMRVWLIGLGVLVIPAAASASDMTLSWQARLVDVAGVPINGSHDVDLALWNSQGGDDLAGRVYSEEYSLVTLNDGFIALTLGADGGLDSSLFESGELWVQVTVDDQDLGQRQPLANVGRAAFAVSSATSLTSGDADTVDGLDATDFAPASHSHGRSACAWSCVDSPGTLICPSGKYVAGLSFPQIGSSSTPPPQRCSSSTNGDDVAVYCCTVQ